MDMFLGGVLTTRTLTPVQTWRVLLLLSGRTDKGDEDRDKNSPFLRQPTELPNKPALEGE